MAIPFRKTKQNIFTFIIPFPFEHNKHWASQKQILKGKPIKSES